MPKKKTKPQLDIDPVEVEKLAKIGATNCEIADFFGCSEATIRGRFCENLTKGRAAKKLRLRQLQWKAAEQGNTSMLIWLGKNELGQSDSQGLTEEEVLRPVFIEK
jgi:hypothetical protein